jgi:hypothetical protein
MSNQFLLGVLCGIAVTVTFIVLHVQLLAWLNKEYQALALEYHKLKAALAQKEAELQTLRPAGASGTANVGVKLN